MSTTTDQVRATARGGEASGPPRRWGSVVGLVALTVLAGLALGRFLFLDGTAGPTAPAARPATLAQEITALERQVEADPNDLPALQRLGIAYTDRAIASGDPAFYDLAVRAFDRAEDADPDNPDTLVGRGRLLLSLHQFSEALEVGLEAVELRPGNAASLGVVVDAQVELGDYEAAAESLQRMLDVRPDLQSLSRASYLRELHGDLDGARVAMQQALTASSGAPLELATLETLLADLQLLDGGLDDAADGYERALESEPTLPGAVAGLARVQAARGDLDGAITRIGEAAQTQPVAAIALLHADLLRLAGRTGEAEDADAIVRAVADLQSSVGQIVDLETARFEAARGDPAEALALARRAFDLRPDNVFAQSTLAWALHRSGDTEAAVPFTEQALRLGSADVGVRVRAAVVFEAIGRADQARESLEVAFASSPWTAVSEADDAVALAERLGVSLPPGWSLP